MIPIFVLVCAASLLDSASSAADSLGTQFRVVFPRNFELSSSNCTLSISVINPNKENAAVNIVYYGTKYNYSSKKSDTVTVPAGGMVEHVFPSFDAWEFTNGGFQQQFDTRVVVTTSLAVAVFATNQHVYGAGDTFQVLPYSLAGTSYAFTLPAPAPLQNGTIQYALAYIIPTRTDVNVQLTVGAWTEKRLIPFAVGTDVHYFAVPQTKNMKDPSFYITGDSDFLVVAAVTCLRLNDGKCDYAAFMPPPVIVPGECASTTAVKDDHPTDLITSRTISVTPNVEASRCATSDITLFNDESSINQTVQAGMIAVPAIIGDRLVLRATSTRTTPVRVGGLPGNRGAFLSTVPSTAQFVTGTTFFLMQSEKGTLYIITDAIASLTMRLDGGVVNFSPEIIKIDGTQYHFTTVDVTSSVAPTVHTLDASPGKYIFYVVGSFRTGHTYGFYPAFNQQKAS